jgi:hypothetical protein
MMLIFRTKHCYKLRLISADATKLSEHQAYLGILSLNAEPFWGYPPQGRFAYITAKTDLHKRNIVWNATYSSRKQYCFVKPGSPRDKS